MKVCSISDIHLNNFNKFAQPTDNQAVNSRLVTTLKAVGYAFDTASKQGANIMVVNGDFFDVRQSFSVSATAYIINTLQTIIARQPQGFTTIFNVGNHDELGRSVIPNSVSMFEVLDTPSRPVKVVDGVTTFDYDDSSLVIVPYQEDIKASKEAITDALTNLTKPTVVFAHVGIDGSETGRWGRVLDGNFSVDDFIAPKVTAVVVGHYHTRNYLQPHIKLTDYHCEDKDKLMRYGKVDCWYQGDLLPINFNDVKQDGTPAPRGFDIIETVSGKHQFYSTANFPQFYLIEEDNVKLLKQLDRLTENNYVQLVTTNEDTAKQYLHHHNLTVKFIKPQATVENDLALTKTASSHEIVTKYCDKYASDLSQLALEYLDKAQKQLLDKGSEK